MQRPLTTARVITIAAPALLLAGAWTLQLAGAHVPGVGRNLYPCEMCHWQRWPLYAALVVALAGLLPPLRAWRAPITLAALLILASGAIGAFHAGVEYGWWEGLTRCATTGGGGSEADVLAQIMATPMIRCDTAQWTLGPLSLAGMNAILSTLAALSALWLTARTR